MERDGGREQEIAAQIAGVREFNRFYTARLGLLRRRHLDGEFALTEARILYEIAARPKVTAAVLCGVLELDAGYLSRLLASLRRRRLVRQEASARDARERLLTLTRAGEESVARLNEQSDRQIDELLQKLGAGERKALVEALNRVRGILAGEHRAAVRVERLTATDEPAMQAAISLLQEYYEAVHVVLRDEPESLRKSLDAPGAGMWLAYLGEEAVGCVALRRLASVPGAGECKRLYVKPAARGHRIGDRLMDELEAHARSQGMEWIYLDSYDNLRAALALYERRGYERCGRYNENPQATVFMRKRLVAGSG